VFFLFLFAEREFRSENGRSTSAVTKKKKGMKTAAALAAGAALRAALIAFTTVTASLDPAVPTTDVDHAVAVRGAAAWTAAGGACASLYADPSYRYPPTAALLASPALALHPAAAKALYAGLDLSLAALTPGGGLTARAAWALNPVSAALAARGSADAAPSVLVLLAIRGVRRARRLGMAGQHRIAGFAALAAGGALGAAAFHRLVPAMHALPLALHLLGRTEKRKNEDKNSMLPALVLVCLFFVGAACVGGAGTAGSLAACGRLYWRAAVAHHATRSDARHSFAPAFLGAHLVSGFGGGGGWRARLIDTAWLTGPLQVVAVTAAGLHGWRRRRGKGGGGSDGGSPVAAACALQALAFIALNRVVTAQYWMWWAALLPAAAVESEAGSSGGWAAHRRRLVRAGGVWVAAHAAWLASAHRLEMRGAGVAVPHAAVWAAALGAQAAGVGLFWAVAVASV
jgi:GPI mannosyltransferase 1 subunit M